MSQRWKCSGSSAVNSDPHSRVQDLHVPIRTPRALGSALRSGGVQSRHVPRDPDLPSRSGGGPELPRAPVGTTADPRVRLRHVSHSGEPSAGSQAACCIKCGWLRRALPDQGMGRLLADCTGVTRQHGKPACFQGGSSVTEPRNSVSAPRAWVTSHNDQLLTGATAHAATAN